MDTKTLLNVLAACKADYERVKAEFGDSESAANELWGIDNLKEIISRLLKANDAAQPADSSLRPNPEETKP